MDAFAVAVCKGLAMGNITWKKALTVGLWFGAFQALMPLLGYFLAERFSQHITAIDHWIAFGLLLLIGGNMIREALSKKEEPADGSLAPKVMVVLAIATSIDALAVGVTFAFLQVDILPAVLLIGCTTFILSLTGVKLGGVCGDRYEARAELVGGMILVLLGTKILLEHLGILT